jgi:hypothetical protein
MMPSIPFYNDTSSQPIKAGVPSSAYILGPGTDYIAGALEASAADIREPAPGGHFVGQIFRVPSPELILFPRD